MPEDNGYLGKRYRNGDSYLEVVGYIDRPAIILRDDVTGEQRTVVIGSALHQDMEESDVRRCKCGMLHDPVLGHIIG
jgi:hypothetical protein